MTDQKQCTEKLVVLLLTINIQKDNTVTNCEQKLSKTEQNQTD